MKRNKNIISTCNITFDKLQTTNYNPPSPDYIDINFQTLLLITAIGRNVLVSNLSPQQGYKDVWNLV